MQLSGLETDQALTLLAATVHYTDALLSAPTIGESEILPQPLDDPASVKYADLNQRSGGLLTEFFQFLRAASCLDSYMSDHDTKRHRFFQEFLIQVFVDGMNGDVGEAMFANLVLQFTPRRIVLLAIAPELGQGGRLEGLLEGRESDVAKYLQRQSAQGYFGEPVFDEYTQFLGDAKNRSLAGESACNAIIAHMFATDPQRALVSMLSIDYGFLPHAKGNCYPSGKETAKNIRKLQLIGHEVSDCLFRIRYSFPLRKGQEDEVKAQLDQLSKHEKWWARLYVAEIMRQHTGFRQEIIIEQLKQDENPLVRESIAAFNGTASPKKREGVGKE